MLRCGKSVGRGVGCVKKCVRVWGKCVGKGVGKCVRVWEVRWGVGVVKKDVGKCGGSMRNPNTSHKIFPQPPHLP